MKKISFTSDGNEVVTLCDFHVKHWENGLVVFQPDKIWVAKSPLDSGNTEFIEANNLKHFYLKTGGGCIVAFPDNVEVAHFSTDCDNNFSGVITDKVEKHLIDKGLNVTKDNNDLLVDGCKVFSTGTVNYNQRVLATVIHTSINCDAELVDKICLKPMRKRPIGLSEYGITSNEILGLILNEYNNGE